MVSNMDIIIHGKPLDSSQRYTTNIDKELAQKIIGEFFAIGIGTIKESEALIVDARYWQGTWTSVYTLLLSQSVKDKEKRPSYFAISLVLPQKYCCLISEVYYLLEKVVRENVLGVYLDTNLSYITSNFEDSVAFERLCSKLQSIYNNSEKGFDRSFQPQATFPNDSYYSIYDCDSLAFINLLKSKGRVIVTENTETKDALASQSTKFYNAAQKAQRELQAKEAKVSELETRITQMEEEAKQTNSRASGTVTNLKNRVSELEATNKQLLDEKNGQQKIVQELGNIISQASDVLGVTKQTQHKVIKKHPDKSTKTSDRVNIRRLLPSINTVLILLIVVGLFMNAREYSSGVNINQESQTQVDSLKSVLAIKIQDINDKEEQIAEMQKDYNELYSEFEQCKNSMNKLQEQMKVSTKKTTPSSKSNSNSQANKTTKNEAEPAKTNEPAKQQYK